MLNKNYTAILLVLALGFLLSGCSGEISSGDWEVEGEADVEFGEENEEGAACKWDIDCPDMSKCLNGICTTVECESLQDCEDTADLCLQGFCMTEEEVFERFDTWTLAGGPCEDTCGDKCKQSMKRSGIPGRDGDFNLCLECTSTADCSDGYWCDRGKCVSA